MKTLTVIENEKTRESLVEHLAPLGFEFIHYSNPLKAMDNLDEIQPDVVFFSAQDFIRHWKPFLIVLRTVCTRDKALFFILKGETFTFEEASKASHLQVTGIIKESMEDIDDMDKVYSILGRKNLLFEHRLSRRYTPKAFDTIDFIFTHPRSLKIISGTLIDLSPGGLSFNPDNPQLTQDLESEEEINFCSLSIEDEILSLSVGIVRNNETLALRFSNIGEPERETVVQYIQQSINRALKIQIESIAEA